MIIRLVHPGNFYKDHRFLFLFFGMARGLEVGLSGVRGGASKRAKHGHGEGLGTPEI